MKDYESFKCLNKSKTKSNNNNFFKTIFIKMLLSIVLVLIGLIFIKIDNKNKEIIEKYIYTDSMSFSYLYKLYKKHLGDFIPFKNFYKENIKKVSKQEFNYNNVEKKGNGYLFELDPLTLIYAFKGGLVIEKTDDKIKVQTEDDLYFVYQNLNNIKVNIYDNLEDYELIGECNNNLLLTIYKKDEYLSYEEFI